MSDRFVHFKNVLCKNRYEREQQSGRESKRKKEEGENEREEKEELNVRSRNMLAASQLYTTKSLKTPFLDEEENR